MDTWTQDLRYSLRAIRKSPGFFAVVVGMLALGIGVNTAIFSLVNTLFFARMPIRDPGAVAFVRGTQVQVGEDRLLISAADFLDYRERARSFSEMAAMQDRSHVLTGGDEPLRVSATAITANLLTLWGVPVVDGRGFLPGDDAPGAPPALLLSHGFWQRALGGEPGLVGTTLTLDGVEHTVLGILDPILEFGSLAETEVWTPLILERATAERDERDLFVSGKLADGVSAGQARAEMEAVAARLAEENPATHRGRGVNVQMTQEALLDREAQVILFLLVLTVAFVLLIACANVANLLLARSAARAREVALRLALGAARWRILRQLLVESTLAALAAAALGLLLAQALIEALSAIAGSVEAIFALIEIDGNVLLFTLAVSLLTPLLFGLWPAWQATRPNLQTELAEAGSRGSSGGRASARTRAVLAVAQVAMALMLSVVTGLLIRSLISLQTHPLGFDAGGLLTLRLELPERSYGDGGRAPGFFDLARERVASLPGVEGAELVSRRPTLSGAPRELFRVAGEEVPAEPETWWMTRRTATPGYFELMGIAIERGRGFGDGDTAAGVPVAVVSREAAERYWPGRDPLGQRLLLGRSGDGEPVEVVGVASDVLAPDVGESTYDPEIYLPAAQRPGLAMEMVIRSRARAGDAAALAAEVRREIWKLDADLPLADVRTMERIQRDNLAASWALTLLFIVFAAFAMAMASIGVYGVMSYRVSRQTREIGIRMALGASAGKVWRWVVGRGGMLVALGTALGMVGAFALSRLLQGMIFEISATDPLTFVGVPLLLAGLGFVANALPAWRASRVDPSRSLRLE